jgi:hypothetical protein
MRFTNILITINGQSQAIMAGTGGAETVDSVLSSFPIAAQRLRNILQAEMPGANVTVNCVSGPGPATYTAVGGTALIRSLNSNSTAFWNDITSELDTHGEAQRDFLIERASPNTLAIFVHWCQTQDAGSSNFTDALYSSSLMNYYTELYNQCSSSFAEMNIIKLVAGSRDGGNPSAERLGRLRNIADAIGNKAEPISLESRLPYVYTVHAAPFTPRGAYVNGSPDFVHPLRSSSYRHANAVAAQICLINGVRPSFGSSPRLIEARLTNPDMLVAKFVSPGKYPLRRQGTAGFALTIGSIISNTADFDNSQVSNTGFSTLSMQVSGVVPGSRLLFWHNGGGYSGFANGTVPPRGQLANAIWADTGSVLSITDQAEDCVGSDLAVFAEPNQAGVPVDILF